MKLTTLKWKRKTLRNKPETDDWSETFQTVRCIKLSGKRTQVQLFCFSLTLELTFLIPLTQSNLRQWEHLSSAKAHSSMTFCFAVENCPPFPVFGQSLYHIHLDVFESLSMSGPTYWNFLSSFLHIQMIHGFWPRAATVHLYVEHSISSSRHYLSWYYETL